MASRRTTTARGKRSASTQSKRSQSKRTTTGRGAGRVEDPPGPKTTRPEASDRRPPTRGESTAHALRHRLDAVPDRVDIRDCFYQPTLLALPDQVVNCDLVPAILDQGSEGACTGYALAGVINFLLGGRNVRRSVSPRMLYEMARRYDEWPGEGYEGSSARGAMKGWLRHGVAAVEDWPVEKTGLDHLQATANSTGATVADLARQTPGGAYFRVSHRNARDMHAALTEVGILYCTLMVHAGWDAPGARTVEVPYVSSGNMRVRNLPVIERKGRADDGHAVAIVGYTSQGFIIQNSWGEGWGDGGFALLPYEDFLLHATDVWVAQLGVPVRADLWDTGSTDTTEGIQRASRAVPLSEIRPYVVDVGNNGALSDSGNYWTTAADVDRLFSETIPKATEGWGKRRVLLYLHGGLNDEDSVARRIVAFRDVMLANEIYPLHIMWESGAMQSLNGIVRDLLDPADTRAGGVADWMHKVRDGLLEVRDRTFELTAARPGGAFWREMKENARLASERRDRTGAMQLIAKSVAKAFATLGGDPDDWELHVVGHSAGSIFAAHAMPLLTAGTIPFTSLQFLAPAIRVDEFKRLVLPLVKSRKCPNPSFFVLSDTGERDDVVGPYGKSLLYLVSNAFEGKRETPLLGMLRFISAAAGDDAAVADSEVARLVAARVGTLPALVVSGVKGEAGSESASDSHGGFDNDPLTMNSVLFRILGGAPPRPFTVRDLQY
jgi:hypothetical protein